MMNMMPHGLGPGPVAQFEQPYLPGTAQGPIYFHACMGPEMGVAATRKRKASTSGGRDSGVAKSVRTLQVGMIMGYIILMS